MMTKTNEIIKERILNECKKGGLGRYLKVLVLCVIYLIKIKIKESWVFIVAIICLLGYIFFIK